MLIAAAAVYGGVSYTALKREQLNELNALCHMLRLMQDELETRARCQSSPRSWKRGRRTPARHCFPDCCAACRSLEAGIFKIYGRSASRRA